MDVRLGATKIVDINVLRVRGSPRSDYSVCNSMLVTTLRINSVGLYFYLPMLLDFRSTRKPSLEPMKAFPAFEILVNDNRCGDRRQVHGRHVLRVT